MPTVLKLDGAGNYLSWAKRALLIVEQKDLEGYVLGTVAAPEDKMSAEGKKWKATNSLLVGWLLNSVEPPIARFVEGLSTAAEIWKTLSTQYSGKDNVMVIAHGASTSVHVCKIRNKYLLTTSQFSVACDQGKDIYMATSSKPSFLVASPPRF